MSWDHGFYRPPAPAPTGPNSDSSHVSSVGQPAQPSYVPWDAFRPTSHFQDDHGHPSLPSASGVAHARKYGQSIDSAYEPLNAMEPPRRKHDEPLQTTVDPGNKRPTHAISFEQNPLSFPGSAQYRQNTLLRNPEPPPYKVVSPPSAPSSVTKKRKRTASKVPRGTRHNPFDLDSSPEMAQASLPRIKVQATPPPNPTGRHHTPPQAISDSFGRSSHRAPVGLSAEGNWRPTHPLGCYETQSIEYFAVPFGRRPGVYTDRQEALEATGLGPEARRPKLFTCKNKAEEWLELHKRPPPSRVDRMLVDTFLDMNSPILVPKTQNTNRQPDAERPVSQSAFPSSPPPPYSTAANTAADIVPIVEPTLCREQAELVDLIMSGRNVFYTGSAGCGKSTVLKAFNKRFQERSFKVKVIAPTGRAALDINGSTTWTYAGWTPDHHKKPLLELKKAAHGKFVRQRMKETDVLVIDEISMVENLHFERLNAVMKEARGDIRAFGGVQLIVTGDFCQLPPVKPFRHCIECGRELVPLKEGAEYKCRFHGTYYDIDKWAFRSKAWEECNFAHVNLTTIHRQSDKVFIDILNKLRIGSPLSTKDRDLLLKHENQTRNAIMLFPTRAEVKRVNDDMFNKLRSQPRSYQCLDHFKWNEEHRNLESKSRLSYDGMSLLALADHRFEPQIQLKKGMLVVLLHNLDLPSGLVNGSQGTIQGFEDYDPAKLPKSTAKGRDKETNAPHMGSSLTGDYASFRELQVKEFINKASFKKWPIVTFLNGVTRTIYADCTVNELGDKAPYSLLSRTQIPLMAAWAMTTHKSQGMTLNRVRVDLAKSFEEGQAYVALSRARSLEGLEVISLPPPNKMHGGNPQVKEFLRQKFGL